MTEPLEQIIKPLEQKLSLLKEMAEIDLRITQNNKTIILYQKAKERLQKRIISLLAFILLSLFSATICFIYNFSYFGMANIFLILLLIYFSIKFRRKMKDFEFYISSYKTLNEVSNDIFFSLNKDLKKLETKRRN